MLNGLYKIYIVGYEVTHYLSDVLIGKAVYLLLDARKVATLGRRPHCIFSAYEGLKCQASDILRYK